MDTDVGVCVLWPGPGGKVDIAADVWQLGLVNLAHVPHQQLAHGVETILALAGREAAVEDGLDHGDLDLDILDGPAHGLLGPHRDVQPRLAAVAPAHPLEAVADVDGDGHHAGAAHVVGHQTEVAVRRNEAQQSLALPLLVANTRMEGHVVKQSWIDKCHG